MGFKTFFSFSMVDKEEKPYLTTSAAIEYTGKRKDFKSDECLRLIFNRAATIGDLETVRFMIENGFEVKGKTLDALPQAIDQGHEEVALLLIHEGADVCQVNPDTKQNLLHRAALKGLSRTCETLLLTKNFKIDSKNKQKSTALHCAAVSGDLRTVQVLIHAGASIKVKNEHKNTPLRLAMLHDHQNIIPILDNKNKHNKELEPGNDPLAPYSSDRISRVE